TPSLLRRDDSASALFLAAWLCRSPGRTLPPTRWLAAHLSRRPTAAHPPASAAGTDRTQTRQPLGGPETQTQDASHLQPRRPSSLGCRHLIHKGGDILSLQLIRHFMVATTPAKPQTNSRAVPHVSRWPTSRGFRDLGATTPARMTTWAGLHRQVGVDVPSVSVHLSIRQNF